MTSKTEQLYIRHIAELEKQLKQRDDRIATLEKQVAELIKVNAELTDKVAKLRILQIVSAHTAMLISGLSQRLALSRQIISLNRRYDLLL